MTRDLLLIILKEAAHHSPSGENAQPWQITVYNDNTIRIHVLGGRDISVYNTNNRTTYIACGALLENISIVSQAHNHIAKIEIFPNDDSTCVAQIMFETTTKPHDENEHRLFSALPHRQSNREAYQKASTASLTHTCSQEHKRHPECSIYTTDNKETIKNLARSASINDYLITHNKTFHSSFFSHVIWETSKTNKPGFYIPTLGISLIERLSLPFVKHWPIISALNYFGFYSFVTHNASRKMVQTSLMGSICIKEDKPDLYVEAGRTLERVWLAATASGLSFQVLAMPLLYFTKETNRSIFSDKEYNHINQALNTIKESFPYENEIPVLLFRTGKTKRRVPDTPKMDPIITYA